MRRHHLIDEAKADLDLAYEEVKRAELRAMEIESSYCKRIEALLRQGEANGAESELVREKEQKQIVLGIDALHEMQTRALERFAALSTAFAIATSVSDPTLALNLFNQALFRSEEPPEQIDLQETIRQFHRGLRAYTYEDQSFENDKVVRASWGSIESALRRLSRSI